MIAGPFLHSNMPARRAAYACTGLVIGEVYSYGRESHGLKGGYYVTRADRAQWPEIHEQLIAVIEGLA